MPNDVKQCFGGSNVHCGSCSYDRIQYGNADVCSDVAGPSSSGSDDLFELLDRSNENIIFLFLSAASTTDRHLFELDFNSHTAFEACYVIMHKVYCNARMC